MLPLLLLGEIILLFFLSKGVTQAVFEFFLLLFRSRTIAVTCVLLLEFPGTVVHELAHLFTAEILRVHTGRMSLVPESIRGEEIRSGSVAIGVSDPFRRYAIGLAPLFFGIVVLTSLSYILPSLYTSVTQSVVPIFQQPDFYWLLLVGYCVFAVSITMFPSPPDIKGIVPFAIVISLFVVGAFFLGLRFTLTGWILQLAQTVLTTLIQSLGIVIGFNVVLLILIFVCAHIISQLSRTRILRQQ